MPSLVLDIEALAHDADSTGGGDTASPACPGSRPASDRRPRRRRPRGRGRPVTGTRSANSSARSARGRRRTRSSTIRASGAPVRRAAARRSRPCSSPPRRDLQSRRSANLSGPKNEALTHRTSLSTDAPERSWRPRPRRSTPNPRSSIACANAGFQAPPPPSTFATIAAALRRSKTATSGTPPMREKCSTRARRSVSSRRSGMRDTSRPARIRELRHEEVDVLHATRREAHVDVRRSRAATRRREGSPTSRDARVTSRPQPRDESVKGALASLVAGDLGAAQEFERSQLRILSESVDDERPETAPPSMACPDPRRRALGRVVEVLDGAFGLDPADLAQRDPGQPRHLGLAMPRSPENLHFVALDETEHACASRGPTPPTTLLDINESPPAPT